MPCNIQNIPLHTTGTQYSSSQNVPSPPSSTLTRNLLKILSTSLFLGSQQDRQAYKATTCCSATTTLTQGPRTYLNRAPKKRPGKSPNWLAYTISGHASRRKNRCGWYPRSSQAGGLHFVTYQSLGVPCPACTPKSLQLSDG